MSQEPAHFATEPIETLVPNTIRTLAVDAVEKAKSGHCGLPMGCADFAFVLWTKYLKFNPTNPHWANRDRFVLSAGHGSMLIYSLLHLTGFEKMTLDQLKNFRQWGSLTPGHPESHETEGVEVTTGPLGQGTGNSVGLAIAQKFFAATFNTPEFPVSDHKVYAIVSDGDLQEGVSHEAAGLAGHLGLDNLVWFYDDNSVSIEGMTSLSYSDDVPSRFAGYHWHVISINGNDQSQIDVALKEASATKSQPTIIIGKTIIGKGSPKLQGTPKAHSDAFGPEEVAATKRNLDWPADAQFLVPDRVKTFFAEKRKTWAAEEAEWNRLFAAYGAKNPEKAQLWNDFLAKKLPADLAALLPKYGPEKAVATRNAGGEILKALFGAVPNLIGGSADLAPSTKTWIKEFGSFEKGNYGGRNLHFGIREHGMGAVCAGLAYYGGLIPFGSTFFVFTDYMRPPIRLASLSGIQTIYVFTHDSICVGEDGPTHEPVEHLATIRAIPGVIDLRPGDANEAAYAWIAALEHKHQPSAIMLTRQNIPVFDRTQTAPASETLKGGYTLWESKPGVTPEIILIGTGSETFLALDAARKLGAEGKAARAVSLPSWALFESQSREYRDGVLPPAVTKRVAVEAGIRLGWERYITTGGKFVGVEKFGASAPYERILKEYGLTVDHVLAAAKSLL
ncbi:MAG TPA: transketolase [Candidatus Methylacidiphilales bacterium]|jgi:transketolase|nr:transketolase [Candidatus Methylacidiphilales bacterium]